MIATDPEHKKKKVGKAGRLHSFLRRQQSTAGTKQAFDYQFLADQRNRAALADVSSTLQALFDV